MASSGMLLHVAVIRTDVSIRVTRITELGTTLPVTSNRRSVSFLALSRYFSFKQPFICPHEAEWPALQTH
jgi:hypothetical protein